MIMFGSFLPSLWSSTNHSLLGSKEPTLLCNHLVLAGFHFSGLGVVSNDADRFKRFCFLFFLSTNTPSPRHADRVSVLAVFHLCHPNSLGPFSLHRFGAAHQTSLRSRSTRMSYAISP